MPKRTLREKLLDGNDPPKIKVIVGRRSKRWGEGTCAIPAPIEADENMRAVPRGKRSTMKLIRDAIAMKHHATMARPIRCGLFSWIAAQSQRASSRGQRQEVDRCGL
jgi:hypothetical protein